MCPPSMTLPRVHPRLSCCIHARSSLFFASHFALIHPFKLYFLHACIDMDTCDIVYLSSDEETPFERNQRLIQEHHTEEDRRQVQSHHSRVLQEVKEGKRKTLRIAALPEPLVFL